MKCVHEGCERVGGVRGLCPKHYTAARRAGLIAVGDRPAGQRAPERVNDACVICGVKIERGRKKTCDRWDCEDALSERMGRSVPEVRFCLSCAQVV